LKFTKRFRKAAEGNQQTRILDATFHSVRVHAESGLEFALGLLPLKIAPVQNSDRDAWFSETRVETQCALRTGSRLRRDRCRRSSLIVG